MMRVIGVRFNMYYYIEEGFVDMIVNNSQIFSMIEKIIMIQIYNHVQSSLFNYTYTRSECF